MSDHLNDAPPTSPGLDDEFERLGRKAGAELRTPPPADGHRRVERTSEIRRATIATITASTALAVVVAGLLVLRRDPQQQENNRPVEVTTTTMSAVASTSSVPSVGAAGSFRLLADSQFAPTFPSSATWIGDEAILLGANEFASSTLSAVAFDPGRDQWRQLADPPAALTGESLSPLSQMTSWTGSEVLVSTNQGEVFAYDPVEDMWNARRHADDSMGLAAADSGVAVSARGVLARSSTGWWWYDNSADSWEALPSPAFGTNYAVIDALDSEAMVATQVDGSTITSAVFDITSRTWRNGPPVELVSQRGDSLCDAADGLLVCVAEGFGNLTGVVIDPLVGATGPFTLGNHSSGLTTSGIPWITHAWTLLIPRSATWEDLPPLADIDSFDVAVWTGSEIVFFAGSNSEAGRRIGTTASYTPVSVPGQ